MLTKPENLSLSLLRVSHLLLGKGPALRVTCIFNESLLEKITISFTNGFQLEIAYGFLMGPVSIPLLPYQAQTHVVIVHPVTVSMSPYVHWPCCVYVSFSWSAPFP